jgi:hypothetical protein
MKQALPSAAESHASVLAFTCSLCGDVQRNLARCSRDSWQQHLKDVRDRPVETAEMMDLIIDKNITRGKPIILCLTLHVLQRLLLGTIYKCHV